MGAHHGGLGHVRFALLAVIVAVHHASAPNAGLQLDKDGKITVIVPVAPAGGHGESARGRQVSCTTPSIRRWWVKLRRRLGGALPADHHGNCRARSKKRSDSVQKYSADPQQPVAADEQCNYQTMMSREGKEKPAPGGADGSPRGTKRRQARRVGRRAVTSFVVQ